MTLNEASLIFTTYGYPILAGLHLAHAFLRAYRYWQIQRDPWLKWKILSSFGSFVFFGLYASFVSRAPLVPRDALLPYARLSAIIIIVGLGVAVIGQLHDIVIASKMREQAHERKLQTG